MQDTITIDAGIVGQLEPAAFDWNVPGFRDDLVDALIRSLPKQLRKLFVPVPETVAVIGERITPDNGPVLESVRRELNRLITEPLPVDAFDLDALPKHLRPSFRIVDTDGLQRNLNHAVVLRTDGGVEPAAVPVATQELPRSWVQNFRATELFDGPHRVLRRHHTLLGHFKRCKLYNIIWCNHYTSSMHTM